MTANTSSVRPVRIRSIARPPFSSGCFERVKLREPINNEAQV
jgi:hypothetical protein